MSAEPNSSPSISVALCAYNGARFLSEQLQTIANQTVAPSEVVVSDDGSTDDSLDIIEAWAASVDFSVKILRNVKPLGPTLNFEQAIAATTGDLVALADQDDAWQSTRLQQLAAHFDADPNLTLLGSGANAIGGNGQPLGFTLFSAIHIADSEWRRLEQGRAFEVLLRRNLFTGATMLFRRELLEVARPFPAGWLHDEWLAIVAAATGKVALVRDSLTGYRQHGSNLAGIHDQAPLSAKLRKVKKLFAPRARSNAWLLSRSEALVSHLALLGDRVPAEQLAKAQENLVHERYRSHLPGVRVLRVVPAIREACTGRYELYDYGRKDLVRDLLQSRH